MAEELIYTSAARGLRPGTRGFCTVAYTRGMKPQTVQLLESLSAYKNLYPVHDPRVSESPVSHSHHRFTLPGSNLCVLSRIGPTAPDHTNRSNKVAHHAVLKPREQVAPGPAWLALQKDFFLRQWNDSPHFLENKKEIPDGQPENAPARNWEELTGDAGWAAVLAYSFLKSATTPFYVVYEPGMEPLPLVGEALALLPVEQRWQITFNTYFTSLPARASCLWRFCVPDSEALREVRRNPRTQIIDLTQPLGELKENPLVVHARNGTEPATPPKSEKKNGEDERPRFILIDRRKNPLRPN